jgi:hypothetical protein
MAHTCDPTSYLGGSDQEYRGSKPALAGSSQEPISKRPNTQNKGLVE